MASYLYQAPVGVVGDISRTDESNAEPAMLVAASGVYAQAYGIPVKYVSGGIQQFTGSETKADFVGLLARSAPEISGNLNAGLDNTVPNPAQPQNLLVRGYEIVKCVAGTPARGGVVYVQVTAHSGVNVGDFRADGTDSGNAVALDAAQATWAVDGKDADNLTEIRIAR